MMFYFFNLLGKVKKKLIYYLKIVVEGINGLFNVIF